LETSLQAVLTAFIFMHWQYICRIAIQPPRIANPQQKQQELELNEVKEMTFVAELSKPPQKPT
jgi:hypothetical protein